MTEDTILLDKRKELKHQLTIGAYKSLAEIVLDRIEYFIQRLIQYPTSISIWYSGIVIGLITILAGLFTSIILREPLFAEVTLFGIWLAGLGASIIAVTKLVTSKLLTTFCENTLDTIESVKDLEDLQNWLIVTFNIKRQILSSLVIGLLLVVSFVLFPILSTNQLPHFGFIVIGVIVWFEDATFLYYAIPIFTLFSRLSQYQFRLYVLDPSNSEVIDHLSGVIIYATNVIGIITALYTLGLVAFGTIPENLTLILILGAWGAITIFFVSGQHTLSRIIVKAKWKKLNEIQMKIEKLETKEDIPSKDTLEHIRALIDYHNQIRATRNSALDIRAGLSFLQSLLLPVIGLLLGNIKDMVEFLFRSSP